ncbi:hypothetical protein F4780DRAFT_762906 [Xylariomycetidae sp. FL0641]|nr:hypothetical protein F4780DRAFT_762906 [Xylariomycetidae sp. FL0641]
MPDLLGGAFSSLKQSVFDKFTRAPPAVDTQAASTYPTAHLDVSSPYAHSLRDTDDEFAKPSQLTPVSASTGSLAISPKTPTNGRPSISASGDDYGPAIEGSPRRPGGYGNFSTEPDSYEGDSAYGTSPGKKQAPSLLTRMNSIAPGPFEMKRKPSGARNAFSRGNSRDDLPNPSDESLQTGSYPDRPGTAASGSSVNSGSMAPPRLPRKNGYGGFGPPQRESYDADQEPFGLGQRAETFPDKLPSTRNEEMMGEGRASSQRPSSNISNRPVPTSERSSRPSFGARTSSRPTTPRKSLTRPQARTGSRNLSINVADDFGIGNPYHSPTVSQSSSNSGFSRASQLSQPSSRTSPARSMHSRRKPSDTSGFDALMNDIQSSMEQLSPIPPTPRLPSPKAEPAPLGNLREPPANLRLDPAVQGGRAMQPESPLKSPTSPGLFGDRIDPAVQGGARSRSPGRISHTREPSRNPRSRGICKSCKEPITGKSVSSADGRLTGRYHKACFVCTTCREPFTTAEFYVLNDQPYCEQHYHKLNGSLCGGCRRGIEGQYLEDEIPQKYHPGCFRCEDCGNVLRDGYFDVGGRSYCERDAFRRMQAAMQGQQRVSGDPRPPPFRHERSDSRMRQPAPGVRSGGERMPSRDLGREREPPRGLPDGPTTKDGRPLNRPFGLPTGNRLMPGQALGRGGLSPIPRMEKRMTRLGMI